MKSRLVSEAKNFLRRARRLSPGEWADMAVGVAELAYARIARTRYSEPETRSGDKDNRGPDRRRRLERVRGGIARAARIVPWRSDCLVQALAARHWLARQGIQCDLAIGVRKGSGDALDAHAWLRDGDTIVVGGVISSYETLFASNGAPSSERPAT